MKTITVLYIDRKNGVVKPVNFTGTILRSDDGTVKVINGMSVSTLKPDDYVNYWYEDQIIVAGTGDRA